MRIPHIALFAVLLAILAYAGTGAAAAPDPLAPLHEATFVTARGIKADLPHGSVVIKSGVIALIDAEEKHVLGIAIGDLGLELALKPVGENVLNLFQEISGKPDISWKLEAAYISAATSSEAGLKPEGVPLAIRKWSELSEEEQQKFNSVYIQCYADGWVESPPGMGGAPAGHPGANAPAGIKLRTPVGKEVFAVAWQKPELADDIARRFDIRIDATGKNASISDYGRGIVMYKTPWAPEKGEMDPALRLKAVDYQYSFTPPVGEGAERKLGHLAAAITATFSVTEEKKRIDFISAPWLEFTDISTVQGTKCTSSRGGAGVSDWVLHVDGEFARDTQYNLVFKGQGDSPDSFDAIGYAGVYRFGTAALWPGEDFPVDISIGLDPLPGDCTYLASGNVALSGGGGKYSAVWPQSTRSVMIVATGFTAQDVQTKWGNLRVFAPPELAGSAGKMESVTAVGAMLEYYTSLWGESQPAQANQHNQPVLLVPGESGVQAFEDAGMVFILGTGGSYGSGAMGLPLVAHEVAHIWWGQGFSGPRWFCEGMANYAAAKFIEEYKTQQGEADPYSYRRYLINFALGSELPISLARRDELDDSAAIYHNSAGFLLTCDNRLPYGLDGPLRRIYEAGLNGPAVKEDELRGIFSDQNEEILPALWEQCIDRGVIETSTVEDETYREMVLTPGRRNYVHLLSWLNPARRKMAQGDYAGAQYCAEQALAFRSEPKDYLFIAELAYRAGRTDEAMERACVIQEMENLDDATRVKAILLSARYFRDKGDAVNEKAALEVVIQDGPAAGLISEVQQAQQRLEELGK